MQSWLLSVCFEGDSYSKNTVWALQGELCSCRQGTASSTLTWPGQASWRATGCKRMVEEEYRLAARDDKNCHQLVALGELRATKGKEKQSH